MKVAIIGFGLMGSSAARAVRRAYGAKAHIIAIDSNAAAREQAAALNLCESVHTDLAAIPKDCDWIILAAPVSVNLTLVKTAINYAGEMTRITDLGSTKADIVSALETHHADFDRFIPAHPMAGRELSGPENGLESLFDNKLVILTPAKTTALTHVQAAEKFYHALGARTLVMPDPCEHDRLMGYVSHLPHLLAFAFVNLAENGNNNEQDYQSLTGAGYQDFTRIAASDPIMWQDIFLANKDNIIQQIDSFSSILNQYRGAILSGERGTLTEMIADAGQERKRLQKIIRKQDR